LPTHLNPHTSTQGITENDKLFSFYQLDRILVVSESPITARPKGGAAYQASTVFGEGEQIAEGVYVVGDDHDWWSRYEITGLKPATKYYLSVFIYSH